MLNEVNLTDDVDPFRLLCYPTVTPPFLIRPAPISRTWMDAFPDHFAYRCLPLNIANMHAWEILCPTSVQAQWNGGSQQQDLMVRTEGFPGFGMSHFGGGILTFSVGYLFRTIPHCNLFVTGPINAPKDSIMPLTAVVETDWSPYTFTMNWIFTRSGRSVEFKNGEPFCAFFPVPKGLLEATEPEIRDLNSDAQLLDMHAAWCWSRKEFLDGLAVPGTPQQLMKWQKHYFRGLNPDGTEPVAGTKAHATRLRLKSPVDLRNRASKPNDQPISDKQPLTKGFKCTKWGD